MAIVAQQRIAISVQGMGAFRFRVHVSWIDGAVLVGARVAELALFGCGQRGNHIAVLAGTGPNAFLLLQDQGVTHVVLAEAALLGDFIAFVHLYEALLFAAWNNGAASLRLWLIALAASAGVAAAAHAQLSCVAISAGAGYTVRQSTRSTFVAFIQVQIVQTRAHYLQRRALVAGARIQRCDAFLITDSCLGDQLNVAQAVLIILCIAHHTLNQLLVILQIVAAIGATLVAIGIRFTARGLQVVAAATLNHCAAAVEDGYAALSIVIITFLQLAPAGRALLQAGAGVTIYWTRMPTMGPGICN